MRYLLLTIPLLAQTAVPPSQMRESSALESSPSQIRLYAGDASRQGLVRVRAGAGLALRSTPDGWVLEAAAAPLRLTRRVLTRDAAGHYPASSDAAIYRNGLLMSVGVDYGHDSSGVLPSHPWAVEDIVVGVSLETP